LERDMSQAFKRLLILVVCIGLVDCTTMHNVHGWQASAASPAAAKPEDSHGLIAGDRITVTTADKQRADLLFLSLTPDSLVGTAGKDRQVVSIPLAQITHIKQRKVSIGKTAGLVALTLTTLLAIGLSNMAVMPGAP
jgi:hypothetical protein